MNEFLERFGGGTARNAAGKARVWRSVMAQCSGACGGACGSAV